MRRDRGFTLIEMSIVIVLIVLFAALITPNVVTMRSAQEQRDAFGAVLDFARETRENAVQGGTTYALAYDSAKNQFVMKKQSDTTTTTSASGTLPAPASRPLANVQSVSDLDDVKTLPLPVGLTPSTFRVQQNSVDPGSWLVHFYPDGTSDGGGVEIARGQDTNALQITPDGFSGLVKGVLPDISDQEWEAGTYAQKI